MRIYTCHHCQNGDHAKCARTISPPHGHFGGSKCDCPCDGDVNFEDRIRRESEAELHRLSEAFSKMARSSTSDSDRLLWCIFHAESLASIAHQNGILDDDDFRAAVIQEIDKKISENRG